MPLPFAVKTPPAVETARQTRGNLRIDRVEPNDLLGDETIAGAVRRVKVPVIGTERAQ